MMEPDAGGGIDADGTSIFPSSLPCPHCHKPGIELGIHLSRTRWYRCSALNCTHQDEKRPPEELEADE